MVGKLILDQCISSSEISKVTFLVRTKTDYKDPKFCDVSIDSFVDYSKHSDLFKDIDLAFFCIGVYTGQVDDNMLNKSLWIMHLNSQQP